MKIVSRPAAPLRSSHRRSGPRGQATVEYSIVAHFILFSGAIGLLPVISMFFEALNAFYDSVFAVIQSGAF